MVVAWGVVFLFLILILVLLTCGVLLNVSLTLNFLSLALYGVSLNSGVVLGGICHSVVVGVLLVFSCVLIFICVYMSEDSGVVLFSCVVCSFVLGVLLLLVGSSLYVNVVGWEVLGVTSFILISYYSTRGSWGSALHTMLLNRVGDVGFVLIICWVLVEWCCGGLSGNLRIGVLTALTFILVLTNSAQYPFNGWLPLAIAAPTPVSALVHSSTLVVAGLYMGGLLCGYIGLCFQEVLWNMVGCITVIIASLSAIWEQDFNNVVALSTSMHLGLMLLMFIIGGVLFIEGHMFFHAIYNSMLFIGVGIVILFLFHEQVFIGSVGPGGIFSGIWGWVIWASVLSLCGLAASSGWATNDCYLEQVLASGGSLALSLVSYFVLALGLVYCIKLLVVVVNAGSGCTTVNWCGQSNLVFSSVIFLCSMLGVVFGGWLGFGGLVLVDRVCVSGAEGLILFWFVGLFGCLLFLGVNVSGLSSMFYISDFVSLLLGCNGLILASFSQSVESVCASAVSVLQYSRVLSCMSGNSCSYVSGDMWFLLWLVFVIWVFCL